MFHGKLSNSIRRKQNETRKQGCNNLHGGGYELTFIGKLVPPEIIKLIKKIINGDKNV